MLSAILTLDSLQQQSLILDLSADSIVIHDVDGNIIFANKPVFDSRGYTKEEMSGMKLSQFLAPEQAGFFAQRIDDLCKKGELRFESAHIRKDGSIFPVETHVKLIEIEGRKYCCSVIRDITNRKQAEEKLFDSRQMLQMVLDNIPQRIFWKDRNSIYLGCNRPLALDCGYASPQDLIGKTDYETASAENAGIYRSDDRTVMETGLSKLNYEEAQTKPDGRPAWLRTSKIPLHDKDGRVIGVLGMYEDITERKQAEEKIRQNEKFVRNILDTVDEGFIVLDRNYRIQTANRAYCTQVSLTCDDVIGKHCYEISHQANRRCFKEEDECAVGQVFETGEAHSAVHKHSDGSGHILFVETKAFPIKDDRGRVTSVIETINNITEKHLLEEERLKTQKLEAIGMLAGGIAHDFNNLLQGVFGYISLARLKIDDRQKSLAALEEAEKAMHLSVRLTNQLLTFSKGGKPVTKRIDLRPLIENAAKFSLSGSRSACSIDVDEDLWQAEADEGQISQVIQNIVLNADQAMPEGGKVEITARNVHASDKALPKALWKRNYVAIAVKDSGIGISEQYLTKVFDPYFTTKEKASGLGLATSYSIIKNHSGMIAVSSTKDKGSTFIIYIPALAERKVEAIKPAAEMSVVRVGKVLLMDDEMIVRAVAGDLIKALGHEVEFAANGREAIDLYKTARQEGKPFDLIILDLTIRGGMGGVETIQKLVAEYPDVRAVVSSGYSDDAAISNYQEWGFKACLKKPYNIRDLRNVLNKMLNMR